MLPHATLDSAIPRDSRSRERIPIREEGWRPVQGHGGAECHVVAPHAGRRVSLSSTAHFSWQAAVPFFNLELRPPTQYNLVNPWQTFGTGRHAFAPITAKCLYRFEARAAARRQHRCPWTYLAAIASSGSISKRGVQGRCVHRDLPEWRSQPFGYVGHEA